MAEVIPVGKSEARNVPVAELSWMLAFYGTAPSEAYPTPFISCKAKCKASSKNDFVNPKLGTLA